MTLGEIKLGQGQLRIAGALLPQPTEEFDHPLGLEPYATTYTGYIVMCNLLALGATSQTCVKPVPPGTAPETGSGSVPIVGGSTRPDGSSTARRPNLSGTCGDATRPRSSVSKRSTVTRRRLGLNGRTTDRECSPEGRAIRTQRRLARVEVSVALKSKGRCRYLTTSGRLSKAQSRAKPIFVRARVVGFDRKTAKSTWRLAKGVRLARGTYSVTVRGVDRDRNVEVAKRKSNRATLRVR